LSNVAQNGHLNIAKHIIDPATRIRGQATGRRMTGAYRLVTALP